MLFVCFCICCFLYLKKHASFITGSKGVRFLPIVFPQLVSIELVVCGLEDGTAQINISIATCKFAFVFNTLKKLSIEKWLFNVFKLLMVVYMICTRTYI